MRRFLLPQPATTGDNSTLGGTDANHIKNVLRMQPGDEILLFDAQNREYTGRIEQVASDTVEILITDSRECQTESPIAITVAQALLKNKKMDTLVRHLTEVGMTRWRPFSAHRSVPRLDNKKPGGNKPDKQVDRWQTIAMESLKQCERGVPPEICPPATFEEMLADREHHDLALIFTDRSAPSLASVLNKEKENRQAVMIIIGPEGGLTSQEIDQAEAAGFVPVSLGPRILKADTAAIAACAIVQHRLGDII